MEQIGFIGLGLIGGSLAKCIKKYQLAKKIIAFDIDEENLMLAYSDGTIDDFTAQIEKFKDCDLIFLCCPIHININYYKKLINIVKPECIITDVASTKKAMIDAVKKLNMPIPFIGGHPMAGSEKSGYLASKPHLFENVYYILTPMIGINESQMKQIYDLIKASKALPLIIEPEEHDRITATISHVPHVIAASLVNMVKEADSSEGYMHTLAAGGFRDITRIASSSPIMWQQICLTNQQNIVKTLKRFKSNLEHVIDIIDKGNDNAIYSFFEDARDYRDSFQEKKPGSLLKTYAITVDVVDEPGMIAEIATLLSNNNISIKNIGIINNREYTNGVLEIVFYDEESINRSIQLLSDKKYIVYNR